MAKTRSMHTSVIHSVILKSQRLFVNSTFFVVSTDGRNVKSTSYTVTCSSDFKGVKHTMMNILFFYNLLPPFIDFPFQKQNLTC